MTIQDRLLEVRRRMIAAAARAGRAPESVRLIAVTKGHEAGAVREAIAAGAMDCGENRLQEAEPKIAAIAAAASAAELPGRPAWHMIGHLQTNKAKQVVRLFDWVHSVDSERLGEALHKECEKQGREQLNVLMEINISGEESKMGLAPSGAEPLLRALAAMPRLRVRGLMTMAPYEAIPEETRPVFRGLRELRDRLAALQIPGVQLTELSMGMTNDFEIAIEEGSTFVRVGRAIFED